MITKMNMTQVMRIMRINLIEHLIIPLTDSRTSDAEPEIEYVTCDYCDFITENSDKGVLRDHKQKSHNWCWVCGKKFDSKKKYKNHHYVIHSGNYKSMWD